MGEPRSFKVTFSEQAVADLKAVAEKLGVSPQEVLRRCLLVLSEYVKAAPSSTAGGGNAHD